MKNILILIAAIVCSTANAQTKTEALQKYFGGIPAFCEPAGAVEFHYHGGQINRESAGNQPFEAILKSGGFFQDNVSFGKLKYILVNGKTVQGATQATAETKGQVKPLFGDEKPRRTFATMAKDSAGVKQQIDGIKRGYDDATDFAETFWGYFFKGFDYVKWLFYGTGAVALYFALVGKTEYTHTGKWQDRAILWIQRMSALILFVDVTAIVAIYLIQAILQIKDWDFPVIINLGILYLIVQVLAWLTSWLIPNATVNNGGFDHKKGGNDEYYERKQLQNRN